VTTFTLPLTITVRYTDTEVAGLDESTLGLHWWDDLAACWTPVSTTLDLVNNAAIAHSHVLGLFALLVEDDDQEGPSIGQPVFSPTVASRHWLTITVPISDASSGNHGVDAATLYYSYSLPYTQTAVDGAWPGSTGDGVWTFAVPPQGEVWEGTTLKFSIEATDGDVSPTRAVNDNGGTLFAVTVVESRNVYLPFLHRTR
jgi:hypothetical protein